MQVFRLVNAGHVDKMLAFRSLPKRILTSVRTRDIGGMPRFWGRWLTENGCIRETFKTDTEVLADRNLRVIKTPIGTEPCFYVLEYSDLNADKEKWREISDYVRRVTDTGVRLTERLEDMGVKMADNSYTELKLEPDEIPIIEVPDEAGPAPKVVATQEYLTPLNDTVKPKRGRPKKIVAEV